MASQTEETIAALRDKIATLEKSSWITSSDNGEDSTITPELRRARRHVQESHCYSSIWKHCPSNYYTLSLDERKVILGAKSINQLCKSCLFENKNYVPHNNKEEKVIKKLKNL